MTLVAKVLPETALAQVSWSSSDANVASVNQNGGVTPNKAGTATITATAGGKSGTCSVTVSAKAIAVTGVSLNKTTLTLTEGGSESLTATVAPSNATNKNVSWSSSNTAIATIDNAGKVTAVKAGSATITVKTEDGNKTATCSVAVNPKPVSVTGVTFEQPSWSYLVVGETATLTATVAPSNATNKNVTWSSSNTSVLTVDNSGKLTAKAAGTVTVTVTTVDGGKTASRGVLVQSMANGHEYVDLGLPSGLLWATCNVKAENPEDYGEYFGWGMRDPYYTLPATWSYYFQQIGGSGSSSSDCGTSSDPLKDYVRGGSKYSVATNAGTPDGINDLPYIKNAAQYLWGGKWRLPTKAEWIELMLYTTYKKSTRNGVNGILFTSDKNGRTIFLPWAGYRSNYSIEGAGDAEYLGSRYWASTPGETNAYQVYTLRMNPDGTARNESMSRYYGCPLRLVIKP